MTRSRLTALLAGAVAAALLGAAWVFLAPTQLGGGTSYAVIVGNSMEPGLHRGDLAVVRKRGAYRPGDAVLYDSRELGAKVLHRIDRVDGGRFVLKGDNNDFFDAEQPTEGQIVGTLWLRVPALGNLSGWLREPLHVAILVGLATLFCLGGLGAGAAIVSRRPRSARGRIRAVPSTRPTAERVERVHVAAGVGFVVIALLGLAAVSFTRPVATLQADEAAYVHQGRFAYEADVARSAAYPAGKVTTGQPVFLRLVSRLRLSFDYALESAQPVRATLRSRLDVRVSDGRGWERVLPLVPERRRNGASTTVSGTLDVPQLERLVADMRELTGSGQTAYSVAVVPHVEVDGRVGAQPLESVFAPVLAFELDDLRLQPSLGEGGAGVGPLAPREPGRGTRSSPAELSLGPASVSVATARKVSLAGLAGLLLLVGLALVGGPRPRREEHARIAARHGHLLLSVRPPAPEWPRVVDVSGIEDLVRLAAHHGRMILHVAEAGGHAYVLEQDGTAFRYVAELPGLRPAPAAASSRAAWR